MSKPSSSDLAKRIGIWLGIVTAVVGLISQLAPWFYDMTVGADVRTLQYEIKESAGECTRISKENSEVLKKIAVKLEENQRHSIELRAGLESLASEVRIRHSVSDDYASAIASPEMPLEERVTAMAAETDDHLSRARRAAPRDDDPLAEALDIEVE